MASTSPSFRIQASGIGISSLYPTTFPERNSHKNWHVSIKTQKQRHSGYRENVYSRVFLIVHLVFNARWTVVTPTLLCSTCITFLLNIFWGIHQELFFMFIPKKIAKLQKENRGGAFLKKLLAYSIQIFWMELHDKCLPWNHWYHISMYFPESFQIIDKFCSSPLMIFLNMAFKHKRSDKKWKDISSFLEFLYLVTPLCVYWTFIAQYPNSIYPS